MPQIAGVISWNTIRIHRLRQILIAGRGQHWHSWRQCRRRSLDWRQRMMHCEDRSILKETKWPMKGDFTGKIAQKCRERLIPPINNSRKWNSCKEWERWIVVIWIIYHHLLLHTLIPSYQRAHARCSPYPLCTNHQNQKVPLWVFRWLSLWWSHNVPTFSNRSPSTILFTKQNFVGHSIGTDHCAVDLVRNVPSRIVHKNYDSLIELNKNLWHWNIDYVCIVTKAYCAQETWILIWSSCNL